MNDIEMELPVAQYPLLLQEKTHRLKALFEHFEAPPLQVFDSPTQHFRIRAEFRIWHDNDQCHYAMFTPGYKASANTLIRINTFPIADRAINNLMPPLRDALQRDSILRDKLFQIEFLATLSGQMLVTLIYHKPLDDQWDQAAQSLSQTFNIHIIGRSRKQKRVLSQDYVLETFKIDGRNYQYRQPEGSFIQPNAQVCKKMLGWAVNVSQALGSDLLELYCGNGNFTLPLAQNYQRVLATEIAKPAVHAARWNIAANRINNVKLARLSSQEIAAAYLEGRQFNRLLNNDINLSDYKRETLLVDPPRAGLDRQTLELAKHFQHILYFSCHPQTLHNNLEVLSATHAITRFALFDQFPYTHHIETGVLLTRKSP